MENELLILYADIPEPRLLKYWRVLQNAILINQFMLNGQ